MNRKKRGSAAEREIRQLISGNVKRLRCESGVSRAAIAKHLGISHQQVQKYEHGSNSISSEKLAIIAALLNRPVGAFFPLQPDAPAASYSFDDLKRMHLLASVLQDVLSPLLQEKVCDLIKSLIESTPAGRMVR